MPPGALGLQGASCYATNTRTVPGKLLCALDLKVIKNKNAEFCRVASHLGEHGLQNKERLLLPHDGIEVVFNQKLQES